MTAPTPDLDLDRVRSELAKTPRDPMEERIGRREMFDALAAVTAERDQARQMLAGAPHDDGCQSLFEESTRPISDHRCDCWKAGL